MNRRTTLPHGTFHAVSVKTGHDAVAALQSALATVTRLLDRQIHDAETNLNTFRISAISHAHTISNVDSGIRAEVTAIASYEYDFPT